MVRWRGTIVELLLKTEISVKCEFWVFFCFFFLVNMRNGRLAWKVSEDIVNINGSWKMRDLRKHETHIRTAAATGSRR